MATSRHRTEQRADLESAARATDPPAPSEPAPHEAVLALQRGAGNAVVARLLTPQRPTLQRFAELEHKAIGDRAVSDVEFRISPIGKLHMDDVTMTYGDLVALGDYFSSPDEIASLAATPGKSKNTIGEVYYALFVSVRGQDEKPLMGKLFDTTAKDAVNERFYRLAAANVSHFPNPRSGDVEMDPRTKAKRRDATGPVGEAGTYRVGHERAVRRAVQLGKAGQPIGGALAIDAFYSHFLTDAFSAGHLRTPRVTVTNYWHRRVPDFYARFLNWLGDTVALWVSHHGGQLEQMAPRGTVRKGARQAVKDALKTMPAMTFGDVVGLAVHDYDSERGVLVRIGGKKMRMVGDGHLLDPEGDDDPATVKAAQTTMDIAVKAVQASERDIATAYEMGAGGTGLDAVLSALTRNGNGLFLAERLVPVPVPDNELTAADKSLTWAFDTVDDLFKDKRMRRALTIFANNKAAMFDSIMDDPSIDSVAKQGLQVMVRQPMESTDPNTVVRLFREILAHQP